MRISLFGIGYVGTVSAACLARDGHSVIAIDTNQHKVEALNRGCAPIVEPRLEAIIQAGVASGRLLASTQAEAAVRETDLSIICVGTPSAPDGSLDTSAVERVATVIGGALAEKADFHTVAVRSTLPIGTTRGRIAPSIEQASGLKAGDGFGLACYPEFLREGSAIRDYDDPCHAVMAVSDDRTLARLQALRPKSADPPVVVSFEEAEAVKSVNNAFHALKVGFANEIGGVLAAQGIDSHRVMDIVCADRRLNISPAYLKPGFAFGGSCLPKDIRAFSALGKRAGRVTPMLDSTLAANAAVIERAVALVQTRDGLRVSIIGLAFKPGTDDLRESPYLALAERLMAKGCDIRLFDPCIRMDRLTGANLAFAERQVQNLGDLLCDDLEMAVRHAQTLVLCHPRIGAAAFDIANADQRIIDLVRVQPHLRTGGSYQGLAW